MKVAAVCAVLLLAACGDTIAPPPPDLTVQTEGRLERGGLVQFTAALAGQPATGVTYVADPAAAVVWEGAGLARFTTTGNVRITASSGRSADTLDLTIVAPPSIAFERVVGGQRDIWRVDLDGAGLTNLTADPAENWWASTAPGFVHYVSFSEIPAPVMGVPVGTGASVRTTTVSAVFEDVAISPDGTRLAFTRLAGGMPKLFVSDRSGANARRVVPGTGSWIEGSPAWSPDGTKIAFMTTTAGTADIHVVSAAGGVPTPVVATPAAEVEPAWSPGGTEIVFARANGNDTHLWSLNIAAASERQLTTQTGTQGSPAWLADGRIVFVAVAGSARILNWLDPQVAGSMHQIPGAIAAAGIPVPIR